VCPCISYSDSADNVSGNLHIAQTARELHMGNLREMILTGMWAGVNVAWLTQFPAYW